MIADSWKQALCFAIIQDGAQRKPLSQWVRKSPMSDCQGTKIAFVVKLNIANTSYGNRNAQSWYVFHTSMCKACIQLKLIIKTISRGLHRQLIVCSQTMQCFITSVSACIAWDSSYVKTLCKMTFLWIHTNYFSYKWFLNLKADRTFFSLHGLSSFQKD